MPLTTSNAVSRVLPLVLLAGFASVPPAPAQVGWNQLSTVNAPSPRGRSGVAYDEARDRMVLFGGGSLAVPPYVVGETWLFDGNDWNRVATAAAPSPRQWSVSAYDRQRQRVVLFGGLAWTANPFPWIALDDTWEWDGVTWHRSSPQTSPPPRAKAGLAYDEERERIVMFGGYAYAGTSTVVNLNDTWEWDGVNWTQASPTVRPSLRADPRMFYDRVRRRVIMTGGVFDNGTGNSRFLTGTWEWDGNDWTRLAPALDPVASVEESVVYDDARRRAVRFQSVPSARVFEWDGTTWLPRTPGGVPPTNRFAMNAAYDGARQRVVLFGGRSTAPPYGWLGQTWSYAPVSPADFEAFGTGCAGSAGTPELHGSELPWTGGTFSGRMTAVPNGAPTVLYFGASRTDYAGIPLPLDLTFLGATGCTLLVSLDLGIGLTSANGNAPWTVSVPDDAALHGQAFFLQGAILDPTANPFGVTFSDAAAATVGGR